MVAGISHSYWEQTLLYLTSDKYTTIKWRQYNRKRLSWPQTLWHSLILSNLWQNKQRSITGKTTLNLVTLGLIRWRLCNPFPYLRNMTSTDQLIHDNFFDGKYNIVEILQHEKHTKRNRWKIVKNYWASPHSDIISLVVILWHQQNLWQDVTEGCVWSVGS